MPSYVNGVEGVWKIVDYPKHSECVNSKIDIKGYGLDPNVFKMNIHVVNHLNCILQHNSTTNQWKVSDFVSTKLMGLPEEVHKEHVFRKLIFELRKLEVENEEELILKMDDGEQVRLQRLL